MDERETALVGTVRELARDEFSARAAAYDRDGQFPTENIKALKKLGIPGMALPEDAGGLALGGEAQMRIMEEIAYGDGSTAVALNMHRIGADLLLLLPPFPHRSTVLEDISRNGGLLCAPGSIPTGELDNRKSGFIAVDEGDALVVSGRTGFASMSEGATWVFMGGMVDRGADADGNPTPDLMVAAPRVDTPGLQIMHNWDGMGLRATASHDIVAEGVRIAKDQALVVPIAFFRAFVDAAQAAGGVALQRRSYGTLGILAIWLGLSQAAFDFTVEYVKHRHGYLAGTTSALGPPPGYRAEQPWAQTAIGNMDHWLGTGRVLFYDMVAQVETPFATPQEFTRRLVRTVYHLRRMSEEVAMGAMKVCGAHAYVKERPLERIFRDLIGGVVMAWKTDELAQTLGRGALGMPISIVGPAGS